MYLGTFYNSYYGNGVPAMFLSVVQLKGKHCRKPHCRDGVVDMFGHCLYAHISGPHLDVKHPAIEINLGVTFARTSIL